MKSHFNEKKILISGGVGSIGSEITKKILEFNPKVVRILDNNETGLFNLGQELQSEKIRLFAGDIRDKERLKRAIEDSDIVFHAAALKHVPLCEYNPFEAIKTNILGTQNLIEVAMDEDIEKFITISTDKAVNPVNVMGATKLLAERLTISANYFKGDRKTAFSCVRFGNVMSSKGSVIPLFKKQIAIGGPVTITDADMTRFMMPLEDAVDLVFRLTELSKGGEIFIFKMPTLKIMDLAKIMIEELAPKYGYPPEKIKIKEIGSRPGEKNHEELMTKEEAKNALETKDMFIILPQLRIATYTYPNAKPAEIKEYSSNEGLLTKEEIRKMIINKI